MSAKGQHPPRPPFHAVSQEIGSGLDVNMHPSVTSSPAYRDKRLDALKGIAIALVVFGHALSYQIGSPAERTYLGIAIWSVHMQLFAFVSGLVTRGVAQNPGGFVVRRARQLLVPYLCWTAIAALIAEVSLRSVMDAERTGAVLPAHKSVVSLHAVPLLPDSRCRGAIRHSVRTRCSLCSDVGESIAGSDGRDGALGPAGAVPVLRSWVRRWAATTAARSRVCCAPGWMCGPLPRSCIG